ncbi:MAG: ParA family protein [Candidatus Poribacteria bacterium]|nr:ParA family protein [Candidatus Poribacteria bacterium]
MKTLAILSRKGGTGKTTLAVNLASAAEHAGHRVVIVDLDSQASASEWGDWRDAETPAVISVHSARLPQVLHKLQQDGITFAILDTPPKIEDIAGDAAKAADLAVIPCKLGAFDLKAIEKTILVGNMAKCPMRIVFNAVRARTSMLHPAKRAVQVYEVDVAPCVIGDRVVFSHSVMEGLSVMEYDVKGKASIEIQALFRYIAKEMEVHDGTTT